MKCPSLSESIPCSGLLCLIIAILAFLRLVFLWHIFLIFSFLLLTSLCFCIEVSFSLALLQYH